MEDRGVYHIVIILFLSLYVSLSVTVVLLSSCLNHFSSVRAFVPIKTPPSSRQIVSGQITEKAFHVFDSEEDDVIIFAISSF